MSRYIAWIPTNLGELQPQFVQESLDADTKSQIVDFSDTIRTDLKKNEQNFRFEYTLNSSQEPDTLLTFTLFAFPEKEDIQLFSVNDGKVFTNGKITFTIKIHQNETRTDGKSGFDRKEQEKHNIPNSIYTFIKQKIHTDMHHEEKVDNLIYILQVPDKGNEDENEKNWKKQTVECLNAKIKGLEHDAKRLYKDSRPIAHFNKIQLLYLDAQGIDAYRKNFIRIFGCHEARPKDTEAVLESFCVLNNKINLEKKLRVVYAGLVTTAITFFISLSIIFQNHFCLGTSSVGSKALIALSLDYIAIELLHHIYFGKSLFIVNPKAHAKELYQRVYIAGHDKDVYRDFPSKELYQRVYIAGHDKDVYRDLPLRYKLLYLFLKYGIYPLSIVAIYILMNAFFHILMQDTGLKQ